MASLVGITPMGAPLMPIATQAQSWEFGRGAYLGAAAWPLKKAAVILVRILWTYTISLLVVRSRRCMIRIII